MEPLRLPFFFAYTSQNYFKIFSQIRLTLFLRFCIVSLSAGNVPDITGNNIMTKYSHYVTGKLNDIGPKTKLGCGLFAEEAGKSDMFFWNMKDRVTCPDCIIKINKVLKLQGK